MPRNPARSITTAAPTFAALGDATRLRIVVQLSEAGPQSISTLTEGNQMTRQGLTKHLQVLEDAGLVASERRGRENVYQLKAHSLQNAQQLLSKISREWDDTLSRLQAFVEADS